MTKNELLLTIAIEAVGFEFEFINSSKRVENIKEIFPKWLEGDEKRR